MTPPRYNVPGQRCFVTVQAVGRSFRFVPVQKVRDSIMFLFARYVTKYGLLVHEFLFMSNHFHFVVTDPKGKLSDFLQHFDSMLSRQLNALRGTTGTNFEKDPGILVIADDDGLLDKAVYTLVNPVAAHLVDRLAQWKAPSSLNMEYGQAIEFPRPTCGMWTESRRPRRKSDHPDSWRLKYRGRSSAPETATLTLARPPIEQDMSDGELREEVLNRARQRERELAKERREQGRKVVGWRNVLLEHFLSIPSSPRALFKRRPRVTGTDPVECAALRTIIRRFERTYRRAVEALKSAHSKEEGKDSELPEFPHGTLQIARRYGICCAMAPP